MLTTLRPQAGEFAAAVETTCADGDHTINGNGSTEPASRPRALLHSGAPVREARAGLLHEIFQGRADARPDATAIVFGDKQMSYGRLERRANRLARYLRAQGVQRGSLVAMYLPRGFDAYTTLLAVLKAGAAYVPIDPECPPDRVAYILENSGAAALVTTAELAESQAAFGGPVIRMDADREAIRAQNCSRLPQSVVGVGPRDLCY